MQALSRYREFAADRGAALITGRPSALASALVKISGGMARIPQKDLRAAGEELKVDVLVDGKLQRDGDRIRLSVQLVRVGDQTPLWADKFDTQFKDIFAVQDAISEKVAKALALTLSVEEQKGLSKRYTESAEAYQLYLTGREQWRTFQPKGFLSSINYYRAALEKDANYALAHAGIADAYTLLGIYGPLTAREAMPKAQEAARKAIELEPDYAEAHYNLAVFYLERNPPAVELARRHYYKSVDLGGAPDPDLEKKVEAK